MEDKNLCGKTRDMAHPYEVYEGTGPFVGWTWKVLKKYQKPSLEASNAFARWMCAVSSPNTMGGCDMGDTYVADVLNGHSMLVEKDGEAVLPLVKIPARDRSKLDAALGAF